MCQLDRRRNLGHESTASTQPELFTKPIVDDLLMARDRMLIMPERPDPLLANESGIQQSAGHRLFLSFVQS